MKRAPILIAAVLLATTAFAHGPNKGPNGGVQVDAGNNHVELVAKDLAMAVYLYDENNKPIDAKGAKATGIFVIDGKAQRIEMKPEGGNKPRAPSARKHSIHKVPPFVLVCPAPDGRFALAPEQNTACRPGQRSPAPRPAAATQAKPA